MKQLYKLATMALFLAASLSTQAQMGAGSGLNGMILKLFGQQDNFTVESEFHGLKTNQIPETTMVLTLSVSSGKIRAEADYSKMKAPGMTPETMATLKKSGLDRMITIARQDKGTLALLYPGRKLYEQASLPKEVTAATAIAKIQKTPLGKETIDGHACTKNKVLLLDAKGNSQELITWEADDLNKFPLKLLMNDGGQPYVISNHNVKFGKPAAASFEVPSDYKQGHLQ